MKIDEFVKVYNEAKDKKSFLSSVVLKDKYVSYAEKISRCMNFVNNTSYVIDPETKIKIYSQNQPGRYAIYSLTLIDLYTEIEIEFDDKKFSDSFDSLDRYGLIDELLDIIPKNEKKRWDYTLSLCEEDIYENERTIIGFLENNINMFNTIAPLLENFKEE